MSQDKALGPGKAERGKMNLSAQPEEEPPVVTLLPTTPVANDAASQSPTNVFAGAPDAVRSARDFGDEISFGFDELFFSRTDRSGIILSGNSVFQRVSVYTWQELVGKPHKIVRHGDTPRAVFYTLWQALKAGQPIGAYVKNRAKNGKHYWVFALATPIEDGYLSVRFRPSSALFKAIEGEYAALAQVERREALTPAESAQRFVGRLSELGYRDYPSFMAAALHEEMAARDRQLDRGKNGELEAFGELRECAKQLTETTDAIAAAYLDNENIPMNFRVLAAQLGSEGAGIGVIATNYDLLSREMREVLAGFNAKARNVQRSIDHGAFISGTARLQGEVADFCEATSDGEAEVRMKDGIMLRHQQSEYVRQAFDGLLQILRSVSAFQDTLTDMRRLAAGLEVTRVMSVVECARQSDMTERTTELLTALQTFQRRVTSGLGTIAAANSSILDQAGGLAKRAAR